MRHLLRAREATSAGFQADDKQQNKRASQGTGRVRPFHDVASALAVEKDSRTSPPQPSPPQRRRTPFGVTHHGALFPRELAEAIPDRLRSDLDHAASNRRRRNVHHEHVHGRLRGAHHVLGGSHLQPRLSMEIDRIARAGLLQGHTSWRHGGRGCCCRVARPNYPGCVRHGNRHQPSRGKEPGVQVAGWREKS